MLSNAACSKKPSPNAGLGKKSDREKQVGAAVARAKAASTKKAKRQAAARLAQAGDADTAASLRALSAAGLLFDQASPMARAVLTAGIDTCRWPMGEGNDFRFCGGRTATSRSGGLTLRSFCAAHAAVAYRGQTRIVAEAA